MLDITALSNALRDGTVSFVAALGAQPFLDADGELVRIRGEDALVVPLGLPGDRSPRHALRLPLEHDGGAGWPARYADIAGTAGVMAAHVPAGITILDISEIRGTSVALLYDWVPGQTLTARVARARANRNHDAFGALLRPVADLADALRASALVHGDIAPGNLIVRPEGGMVLIDLDRAGYRDAPGSEPRRRVGYRLPRGGGSAEEEDAFAFLVVLSSLAILADASLPPDHEHAPEWTHPSLLFSSWDLMDPQRSRLVREVQHQLSPLAQELLDLLIAACAGRADRTPGLLRDATRLIQRSHGHAPVRFDDDDLDEDTWHLAGQPETTGAEPERPGVIDAGWPGLPVVKVPRPEPGWPATLPAPPVSSAPPRAVRADTETRETRSAERNVQALVDVVKASTTLSLRSGATHRRQRSDARRRQVTERLHAALAGDDRPELIDLAMSGALAELDDSARQDVLQVVRALSYDTIARAIATDDDAAILAAIDRTLFAREDDLDPAFRPRVRLAGERTAWTANACTAARERDGRACVDLLKQPPVSGVERLPEAVRRQVTRLAAEQEATDVAQQAIRHGDANALAGALGRLATVRPVWTDRVDARDVVRLLGAQQIEERLTAALSGGTLADRDQWMVDVVIASGRLPEVTRVAGLTPRAVDRMIRRQIEADSV